MELSDITVVVVAHDAGDGLAATLEGLLSLGDFACVHLVDSGSTDGSVERVAPRFAGLRVSRIPDNRGPCVARNHGWREARTPFVLFVDDDMRLAPDCVTRLGAELASSPTIAMVGPRILFAGSDRRVQYEGGVWHYAGLAHMRGQDEDEGAGLALDPCDVDVLTSGCLLARRAALAEIGGFDESLFFLMEDVDLSLRARYLGHRLRVVPAARAWNAGGSEGLSLSSRVYPADRVRLHSRNRILLVAGLYEPRTQVLVAPAVLLLDLAWFVFSLMMGRAGPFLTGKLQIAGLYAGARAKRRALSGRKRVRDRELLGAPPLTLTSNAREKPLVRSLTRLLDAMLRVYWRLVRPLVP